MADYVYIKNYSKDGEIGISRRVFEELATEAVERVGGASVHNKGKNKKTIDKVFNLHNPVKVVFHHNGQVEIFISINIKKGENANKVCLAIQEEVAQSLLAYAESVPVTIQLKVASIK